MYNCYSPLNTSIKNAKTKENKTGSQTFKIDDDLKPKGQLF